MNIKHLCLGLSTSLLFLLPSCVDTGHVYRPPASHHPRPHLATLPADYRPIHYGGITYYNRRDHWYRYRNGRYISCSRPSGYRSSFNYGSESFRSPTYSNRSFSTLPPGYRTIYVGGSPYYNRGSSWYRHNNGRYVRCPRPYGYSHPPRYGYGYPSGITVLPHGYRTHAYHGTLYYSHGNSWYQRRHGRYYPCRRPY